MCCSGGQKKITDDDDDDDNNNNNNNKYILLHDWKGNKGFSTLVSSLPSVRPIRSISNGIFPRIA